MSHADLPRYQDGFFQKFLAELPGSPTRQALEQQQPTGTPLVLLGEYVRYEGAPVTPIPNAAVTPQFAVRVGEGAAAQTYVLLWIVERLDVATDSRETMARILADFRSPTVSATATDQPGPMTSELASRWAEALSTDSARQALAVNLSTLTAAPSGLPTSDLAQLRAFLLHFGTYKPNGDYYAKGSVTDGQFPDGVSSAYLAADTGNVAEVRLQRDNFYCSAVVSERLWSPQARSSDFRQLVYRIEDQGEQATDRWRLALLHTVAVRRPDSGVFNRFIFFHAPVGLGLEIPEGARIALAPSTASFLDRLPAYLADLPAALRDDDTPIVGTAQSPYVLLIGTVTQDFPRTALPEGVIADGTGAVRTFRCPPAHVMALAERPDVQDLTLSSPVWLTMADARRELNLDARTLPAGVTAANTGQGVVVGIVDSGIDGSHPAFLGRQDDATKSRIHSVWRMWESGGQSPFERGGQNAAYQSMRFGREYIGHDEVTTVTEPGAPGDPGYGHGTHVSGIAAGRAVGAWPGGIAPGATLVVVSVGTRRGYVNDVIAGVKYCFQKASELGLPCVVNISLGTERHSHDGTDPLSIGLTQLVSDNYVPGVTSPDAAYLAGAMPGFLPGRVICTAAGNLRGDNLHWQATIPANGEVSLVYQPRGTEDGITFWAYNEDATTVRLRISARDSANAVLATPEVPLHTAGGPNATNLAGGLRVNIHNGPARPNNRHSNPEVYWIQTATPPVALGPWIVRFRNTAQSACVIHGFSAFREMRGRFVFDAAQTQSLIGITYTPAQLASFDTHKVSTPGTAPGVICVAAYTSKLGGFGTTVGNLAPFSSPGPLRAAGPGRRALDLTAPGDVVLSAQAGTGGVVGMSGTSMASPMVTGLVAALLQMDRRYNTGQIKSRLESACRRRPTDTVDDWGLGRIDAALLLRP